MTCDTKINNFTTTTTTVPVYDNMVDSSEIHGNLLVNNIKFGNMLFFANLILHIWIIFIHNDLKLSCQRDTKLQIGGDVSVHAISIFLSIYQCVSARFEH